MFSTSWPLLPLLLLPIIFGSRINILKETAPNSRPVEPAERQLDFLLARALHPQVPLGRGINARMGPMGGWIPVSKRWIDIGAGVNDRYISKNMVPYTFGVG